MDHKYHIQLTSNHEFDHLLTLFSRDVSYEFYGTSLPSRITNYNNSNNKSVIYDKFIQCSNQEYVLTCVEFIDNVNNGNTFSSLIQNVLDRLRETSTKKTKEDIYKEFGSYHKINKSDTLINETCPICLNSYKPLEGYRTLPCKHTFHKKCVDKWYLTNNYCPLCRTEYFK